MSRTADRLEILAGPLAGGSRLVREYLDGGDARSFYRGHPGEAAAFSRKAEEVQRRLDATSRMRVAGAIEPLGDAAPRLQRILSGDGFFVTTGQQPALFGGPLYTLYKVLSAVRLAERLEAQLDVPVVALFWVGSDDHDWDEANHVTALDQAWYPHRIEVAAPADLPPLPMSHRTWGTGIHAAIDTLAGMLPGDRLAPEVIAHVRHEYAADRTVAASFTATMRWLLQGQRVAIVDAAHPLMRRAATPVLLHEIEHAAAHARLLGERSAGLEARGYHTQVAIAQDAANVMRIDAQGRDRLMLRDADRWATRRERSGYTTDELKRLIQGEPESFSPNVLLRPVVESALLPTLAYVAGPGEIAYFAQLEDLFASHGIMPPVVVPRASVTLVEPRVRDLLARTDTTLEDALATSLENLVSGRMRRELAPDVVASLERVREDLRADYEKLANALTELDPTLSGPLLAARNRSLIETQDVERRVLSTLRRRNGELVGQLRRLSASLRPGGAHQERVLGPLPFIARHGLTLVDDVASAIDGAFPSAVAEEAASR